MQDDRAEDKTIASGESEKASRVKGRGSLFDSEQLTQCGLAAGLF
jgi:hypothetical protein